jgi:drug/metabolite transporter (DMT)-like permease
LTYLAALLCVVGIAIGQILFKLSAISLEKNGSFFHPNTAITLISAFALYGLTTIAWVWVLQKIELGQAYPLMALAFVFVPIGSYFFLNERFSIQYLFGIALIILGILISTRS